MNKEQMIRMFNDAIIQHGHYRRSAMVSYDEVRIKYDKLSPTKKMITHKMSMT